MTVALLSQAAWRTHKASCVVITDAPSPSPSPPPPPPFMATEEFKQREPPPKTSEDSSSDDDESSSNADDADEITGRMHAERSAMQAYYREALQAFLQGKWRDAKAGLLHAHTLCEPLADVFVQTECDRMLGAWRSIFVQSSSHPHLRSSSNMDLVTSISLSLLPR